MTLLTLVIGASAVDGWAFWTQPGMGTSGATTGSLAAAALSTPGAATNAITVTWASQASLTPSSGNSSIAYSVERKLGAGAFSAVSSGPCSGSKAYGIASCADSPGVSGSYSYRVVARFATWTATSVTSGPVVLSVDTTPPTVSSIARADASPTNAGSVNWTVVFSEAVSGVDTGDFALARTGGLSGGAISAATGSGTTYTVTASTGGGDGTIGLNLIDDDSITDAAANTLGGAGIFNDNLTGEIYLIDKTVPTVSSINRTNASPTNASSVSWTVTFSEAVTGVGTTDFALAATGPAGASITAVSVVSATTYTVTAATGTGDGALGLNLVDDDTITDATANKLGGIGTGAIFTGQTYTVDRAPTVNSIVRADTNPTKATSVAWTVTFSETVTGVGVADFALAASGLSGTSITGVTAVNATTYTVAANTGAAGLTGTLGLNLVDDDTITDATANKLGGTGTGNGSVTGETYAVDKTPPTLSTVLFTNAVAPSSTPCGIVSTTRFVNNSVKAAVGVSATITAAEPGGTVVFSVSTPGSSAVTLTTSSTGTTTSATLDVSSALFLDGTMTLTARAVDALGNQSAPVSPGNLVIKDTTTPLSATYAALGGGFAGLSAHISGATECGAFISAVRSSDGNTSTMTATGATYDLVVGLLALGSYTVTSTDLVGNVTVKTA